MVDDRERALRIRAFMDEYERRLPADTRTDVATEWCRAVHALADRLDPMNRVIEIAKDLDPSDEVLAELVKRYDRKEERAR